MADFTGGNTGSRVESNKTSAEFEDEAMNCEDLNNNSDTVSRVDHETPGGFFNVNGDSSFLQKVKLGVGESEKNDSSTEGESAIVGNDGIKDKNEIVTNGAVDNGKVHSGNGSVPFQNGDEEISVKDETLEEKNGILDIENNNKEVKDVCDAGNEVEESGMKTYEHQAVETEKVETDNGNGRSLQREEDGTLADDTDGAELEENMNAKVELESEQEEKEKSELASENGEVVTVADTDKLDDVSTDSNSVMNDNSASSEGEPPKPVKEEPVKTRSWRDIAVDGMETIPDKVQFRSRNPMVRRSVPKLVKSVVRSGDLRSNIELKVSVTKSINNTRSSESVSNINERSSINDSTSEEKVEQVAKEKDCKLKFEAEKGHDNNVGADLFAKSKGLDIGQKNTNTSTIAGIDKEEQVKERKRKKEKENKVRKEELRKQAEEEKRREEEAEEEKRRKEEAKKERFRKEEEAKKERLRKEEEAAELRKKLIEEEMEKMRMAEERKKRKAEKAQKRAEYKAQKEAEEKEKKKAKKQKKKSSTSDTSSVSSEITSPEKNSPDASSLDPETSRSAVMKRPVVLPSSKKKVNVPKDPLPLPLALRNRSKRKWLKGIIWSLSVVSAVLMLFVAGNYVSYESLFQSFTF